MVNFAKFLLVTLTFLFGASSFALDSKAPWCGDSSKYKDNSGFSGYDYESKKYPGKPIRYRLKRPEKLEKGKKYPLHLHLHGMGKRGSDNGKQVGRANNIYNKYKENGQLIYSMAPQATDWHEGLNQATQEPGSTISAILEVIQNLIKNEQVDADRVYISGNSMGGVCVALYVKFGISVDPKGLFAAASPVACMGDGNPTDYMLTVPFHGFLGEKESRRRNRAMYKMKEVYDSKEAYMELTIIKGTGHSNTFPKALDILVPWLLKQKRGQNIKKIVTEKGIMEVHKE